MRLRSRCVRRSGIPAAVCLTGVGALGSAAAHAGSWSLEPQFATQADYSSNPQLRSTPESGHSAALQLGLPAAWNDGAAHFDLSPSLRLAKAGGDYFSGMNAYYVSSLGLLQSERTTWKASARWSRDSTVLLEPTAGTLVRGDYPRRSDGASVGWSFKASERSTVDLSVSDESVGYSGALGAGLYDYRDHGAQGSFVHALTERHQLQLAAGMSQYDASEISYSSRSSFAQGGLVGAIGPRWSYTALYGLSRALANGGRQAPSGSVYQFGLTGSGETTSLKLSATKSLQPSGFGIVVQSTELLAQGSWQTSERAALSLSARTARTRDVFGSYAFASRDYSSVSADRSWRVTSEWTLDLLVGWQHARIDPGGAIGAGRSASLSLTRKFGAVRLP